MPSIVISQHKAPSGAAPPAVDLPAIESEIVDIGASSAQSAVFTFPCNMIRVYAEAACWVTVGEDPTAEVGAGCVPMPAGQVEYFYVAGESRVAVIEA